MSPLTRSHATQQDVENHGPDLPPTDRPGGAAPRTGWGSMPNPKFAAPPTKRPDPSIPLPTETVFEDDGKAYTVIHTREERAGSFAARTFTVTLGASYLAAGQDDQRTRLVVRAVDQDIIIGSLSDVGGGQGFIIPKGTSHETNLTQAFYVAALTVTATVSTWMERDN